LTKTTQIGQHFTGDGGYLSLMRSILSSALFSTVFIYQGKVTKVLIELFSLATVVFHSSLFYSIPPLKPNVVAGLALGTCTGSHSKHVFELDIVVGEGEEESGFCEIIVMKKCHFNTNFLSL
jgi:hypothetical protein